MTRWSSENCYFLVQINSYTKMGDEIQVIVLDNGTRWLRRPGEQHFTRDWSYRDEPQEKDQLFLAVSRNALEDFKILTKVRSANRTNYEGKTLLEHVITHKKVEMFDHLMTLDNLEVDRLDRFGQSPLMISVRWSRKEYFALELIKKGANIHLRDNEGETVLHNIVHASFANKMKVAQTLIEMGADVNAQDNKGKTPLYQACTSGNVDWIYMLLYNGALATIPSYEEVLPVVVLSTKIPEEERLQLEDILFDYTFDAGIDYVQLGTLVAAMRSEFALFTRIVEVACDVRYDMHELEQLSDSLSSLIPKHFRVFIDKFSNILSEMIKSCPSCVNLLKSIVASPTRNVQEMLQFIFDSDHVLDFVQTCSSSDFTIGNLIFDNFAYFHGGCEFEIEDDDMFKLIYILLTYGYNVNSNDLDVVYTNYGYCELFKILLHMDIQLVDNTEDECVMARLYYNLNTKIEEFCDKNSVSYKLLCYYNHPKLKEVCLKESNDEEVVTKANSLPALPCLMELSRNAARQYVISRYNVQNSMQFYTILKGLPIGITTKAIIALEKELY